MIERWDEMFGKAFYLEITNEERRFLALNSIEDSWDVTQFNSKTNLWYKRTTVFWEDNIIKKVIHEEKRVSNDVVTFVIYREFDTKLLTENREWILPLTSRGKKKKVNATNIMAVTPFGCVFHFYLETLHSIDVGIDVFNCRNNKVLAIGEEEKIHKITNDKDFHDFMNYYMATCPENYFDKIKELRDNKHVTVKYKVGDVFRMEIDRFHYGYGIITGKIKDILKWKELPEKHSLRTLMMVPIMVRYYDICTTSESLSDEDLTNIPLSRVDICGDNDIIWGTHKIIGHKELNVDDIEFNLVCTRFQEFNKHVTTHTYDSLVADGIVKSPNNYKLYVEWGMASAFIDDNQISPKLKEYLVDYKSPHGGVNMSIKNLGKKGYKYKYNLLNQENSKIREEIFRCLQLSSNASFDDFAIQFGGLTKEQILKKLQS